MNFLITPLITGIFDDATLEKPLAGHGMRGAIPAGAGSFNNISAEFTYVAYDYVWLEGSLPSFTTAEYALLPVLNSTEMAGNETWTAETTLFEAELACEPAATIDIIYFNDRGVSVNITSQRGGYEVRLCDRSVREENLNGAFDREGVPLYSCDVYTTFRTPWTNVAWLLNQDDAGLGFANGSDTYLYVWASGADPTWESTPGASPIPRNITALFCMTSYYSQPVLAHVGMPSGEVISVNRTGSRDPFSEVTAFGSVINADFFAFSIPDQYKDSAGNVVGLGYKPQQLPNVDSRLRRSLGTRPETLEAYFAQEKVEQMSIQSHSSVYMDNLHGLPGFVLGNYTEKTLEKLLDPEVLAGTYGSTLKLLFALSVSVGMVDKSVTELVEIMRGVPTAGFTVNNLWARGAQCGLAVVAFLAVVLAVLIGRRECMLDGEPNSLAAALRLLSASQGLTTVMGDAEFKRPKDLKQVLNQDDRRYILKLEQEHGPVVEVTGISAQLPTVPKRQPSTESLWQLKIVTGVGFLIGFGAIAALLVTAFVYAQGHSGKLRTCLSNLCDVGDANDASLIGLPTLAPINSFRYKVLFSYTPIGLSTGIETLLIVLGSCHCMIGPYKALRGGPYKTLRNGPYKALHNGSAPSSASLSVDYDKSPPHFQFVRALRAGNLTLAALSAAILLSNVLAVAFAGLFSPTIATFSVATEVRTTTAPIIKGQFTEPTQEMYYVLSDHVSRNISRPAWTTPEFYVLPFFPTYQGNVTEYEGFTFGIGVDIKCDLFPQDKITITCVGDGLDCPTRDARWIWGNASFDDPCWVYTSRYNPTEAGMREYEWHEVSDDYLIRSNNCPGTIFPLWLELPADPSPSTPTILYEDHYDILVLKCTTAEKVVELNAAINGQQQVLSTTLNRILDEQELTALYPPNTTAATRLASAFSDSVRTGMKVQYSTTRHLIDWFDYLMATIEPSIVQNLTNITHIPDARYIAEAFEDVYRQLFAINLQLYEQDILSREETRTLPATAIVEMNRIAVNTVMFSIAAFILLFMIVVLVMLYWRQEEQPVHRLPTTLEGMYALLYASNAKEECREVAGRNPEERAKNLNNLGRSYSYGEFHDEKGSTHFGVYRVGGNGR